MEHAFRGSSPRTSPKEGRLGHGENIRYLSKLNSLLPMIAIPLYCDYPTVEFIYMQYFSQFHVSIVGDGSPI